MYVLWQLGIVDTCSMVNYFVNIGMQYGTIVFTSAGVKHLSELSPKVMLEPIVGLGGKFTLQLISQSSLEDYQMIYVSLETAVTKFHPYRKQFASKSKIIMDNIFQEHTTRRCLLNKKSCFKLNYSKSGLSGFDLATLSISS
jgi:hypothetical protein